MDMQTLYTVVFLITLVPSGKKLNAMFESVKIRTLNVNNFCLEHFYTLRYNIFFHIFLCLTTYQKLVFYAGIPLSNTRQIKPHGYYKEERRIVNQTFKELTTKYTVGDL